MHIEETYLFNVRLESALIVLLWFIPVGFGLFMAILSVFKNDTCRWFHVFFHIRTIEE